MPGLGGLLVDEQKWRVERLEKKVDENSKTINELEIFKASTIEKLKTVFERLKTIEKTNKWVSQSFFYLLIGGVISLLFSLVQWLITG